MYAPIVLQVGWIWLLGRKLILVAEVPDCKKSGGSVKLTTHIHLDADIMNDGTIPPLLHTSVVFN
jgi:hypothetical protein